MDIRNALASIAVSDIKASRDWYGRLLGAEPAAAPMPGLHEWQFKQGGWLQLYEKAEHAGHCAVTLVVDDIEALRAQLRQDGYRGTKDTDGEVTRICILADPDGNQVVFAESLDAERNPSAVAA